MGMNTNGNRKGAISDINVTPLVDVMLVLLVIFMITAPLMFNAIKLDLPKTEDVNPVNLNTEQVVMSITLSGEFFLGEDKILKSELASAIGNEFKRTKSDTLFLRADYASKYGQVAKMISYLKKAGISKVALVTEVETK